MRDFFKYGLVEGWKKQDAISKWLLILLFLIILYNPLVSIISLPDNL